MFFYSVQIAFRRKNEGKGTMARLDGADEIEAIEAGSVKVLRYKLIK